MPKDEIILRELASIYFELANSDKNKQNILLHKMVNDLKQPRPIVLIDEIPWDEMNINDELTLKCENVFYREIESFFRMNIYKWVHMPADMVLRPYFSIPKIISSTGIGVEQIVNEHQETAKSHTFVDQFQIEEDLQKLHYEKISYDREATMKNYFQTADIFGDILPLKISGQPTGYELGCKTMDDIVFYRGLETLFFDLIERPEFMHQLIGKLTDIFIDKVKQYDELGLFDGDAYYIHSTSALTNDLHPYQNSVRARDVWGRGLAQIFGSVSPKMHDEFDIQYMIKAMEPFGMVYYGCCEPLHKKICILEQIPNLRKISITPWADIDVAAEIIQNRYVIASKPNPAQLGVENLNENAVRKELARIVNACKRNGCSCDIVLKDISTVCNRPENLFRWQEIAMDIVNNY
ncbi:MAG: hypothetical protein Q8920_01370 [Bacillota bacterium]|nr:hypothetical protein [Bacillota bacterium]